MFPKAQQGGSHSPGTAGIRDWNSFQWDSHGMCQVPTAARGEQTAGKASVLFRKAGKPGILVGFSIRNTHRDVVFALSPDTKSLGEIH